MEGKFKKGDWITNGRYAKLIVGINSDWHYYMFKDGTSKRIKGIDEKYHLWTLEDAKDGDVLYINNTLSESIMIYKSFNNGVINKYASYNKFGFEGENYLTLNDGYIVPATKEQRTELFLKMHEAGYEWDAEKKELKVKPKFEVGDWLVHNERKHIVKVVNHTPLDCEVVNILGYHHTITNTAIENNYHLWTIQDAKDGDVLVGSYGTFIFMSKSDGYCGVLSDNTFIRSTGNNEWTEDLHPATKEQRDLLFRKMNEVGYEWDAEKKELKKTQRRISAEAKEALYDSSLFGKDEKECDTLADKINELHERYPEISFAKLSRICVSVSKWQKKKISEDFKGYFKEG